MTDKPRRDASAEPIEVLSKITPERFNVMREMGYVAYREADGEIRVANAERLHHRLGLLGHAARIAVVRLAGGRLEDIADEDQSRLAKNGSMQAEAGSGIRHISDSWIPSIRRSMNRAIIEPFKPNEVKEGLHEVSVAPRRPGGSVMARYVPPPAKTRIKAKRTVFLPICATRHRVLEAAAARVSPDTIAKILFNSAARLWRRASPQPR